MKLSRNLLVAGFALLTAYSFAQRGKDGTVSITTANRIVNEYTTLTADAAAGATTISVAASGLNANGRFSASLAAGDLVMIIQMQGVGINGETVEYPAGSGTYYGLPNDNTWGEITAYNNCGNHEFAEVSAVPNGTSITLDCGLQYSYTAAGRVQVIRVPRYNALTITGSVTCQAWAATGYTGGIVAIEVLGNTVINNTGGITVSGMGFRGGSLTGDNASGLGGGQTAMPNNMEGAEKGEGVFGYQADYTPMGGKYARGAAGNAGGGGDCHNAGGGGGANGGSLSGWDGLGNPSVTGGAGWISAWNLEGGGFSSHTSPGGGRGGYSFSNTNRDATTEGPQPFQTSTPNSWGGDSRENNGGSGGRPLDYTTGRLFMGGGGGAGDQDNSVGGNGGKGGGLVYLMSYGTVSGTGSVTANGAAGGDSGHDGAGGGGGGGTVIVNSVGAISGIAINANGGNGGSQAIPFTATMQAEGPGGSGGGGYIATSGGSATQTVNPGSNGTTNSAHLTEFPPNGATNGAAGTANQAVTNFTISGTGATVCAGNTASISATISGTAPSGTSIVWYTAQTGGTSIGSGSPFTTPVLSSSTTFYAGTCPGTYRIPVIVTVTPAPAVTVNSPSICAGQTASLSASGGTTYTWSSGTTVTGTNTADASPSATTTYTVTGTTSGCSATAVSTVTVTPLPNVTVNSPVICSGQTATLTAGGGTSYTWSAGTTVTGTNTATAAPSSTTTYTVTGTTASCSATAISTVTVNAVPAVTVNSPAICAGQAATLTANGGTTYTWSAGATATGTNTASASPASTTTYTVTGTTSGCSGTAVATVTVNPSADPTITNVSPVCVSAPAFNMTAATGGGTWSGTGITNAANGTFDPSVSGTGTFTVTYTTGGTCGSSDTALVTVNSTLDATITQPPSVCAGAPAFNMTAATGGGIWSGTGITDPVAGTFDPATAGTGAHVITYTLGGSCGSMDTVTVNVTSLSDATIAGHAPVCVGAAAFSLSAATGGGTWSGTGITDPAAGTFDPATAGTGTFTITYTISGSCGNTDTALITVTPNADATITQPAAVCVGAAAFNLSAATGGGSWSGSGITSAAAGTFDPAVAGAGVHTITYAITGSCASSDTVQVTVTNTSDPTITAPAGLCIGAAPVTLTAATTGGAWSGTGITSASAGTFDPAAAGAGAHMIIYTISGSCGAADTVTINVTSLSDATITGVSPVCVNASAFNLTAATSGGSWSGAGITNTAAGTFDPAAAGAGTHIITYTISGSCGNTDTVAIVVNPPADATIASVAPVCGNAPSFSLSAATPGGTWSGVGVTDAANGTYSPAAAGSGTHTVSYTISGACGATATQTLTVNPVPNPFTTSDMTGGCGPLTVHFTETASASCSSLLYDFGDGSTGTDSDPVHVYTQSGAHTVVITCTDANGCSGSMSFANMITVTTTPDAAMTISPGMVVAPNTPVTFTDASANGGFQLWDFGDPASGVNNNSSLSSDTHTYASEGTYCITLAVSNTGGCVDTASDCITVASDATVIVPNVFTPNSDGNNDEFFISSTGAKSLACSIYDRWGLKIAEWNTVGFHWDGRTTSGNYAPDGTYYYIVSVTGYNDKVIEKQGFLQLLRTK